MCLVRTFCSKWIRIKRWRSVLSVASIMLGSAEQINFPRLNVSPTRMMRTYTPEPRGFRGRRELPREPWRQDPRLRRDPLSFEQAVALGRQTVSTIPSQVSNWDILATLDFSVVGIKSFKNNLLLFLPTYHHPTLSTYLPTCHRHLPCVFVCVCERAQTFLFKLRSNMKLSCTVLNRRLREVYFVRSW